jgi:hypothetical protein
MGIKEAAVPLVLFVVAICGIAQSAITVNAYLTSGKPKDSSYNFSMAILVFSIFLLFGSGYFAYKKFSGEAGEAGEAGESPDEVAQMAEKLAGLDLPTLNAVKAALPNVKALPNIATARASQASFNSAVKNVVGKLEELQTSIDGRVADKLKALQAVQTATATAQAALETSAA